MIELRSADGGPVIGSLTDISLGGCYVETSAVLPPGSPLHLTFGEGDAQVKTEGLVTRMDLGSGVAVKFKELNREDRDLMHRLLQAVQKSNLSVDNNCLNLLTGKAPVQI